MRAGTTAAAHASAKAASKGATSSSEAASAYNDRTAAATVRHTVVGGALALQLVSAMTAYIGHFIDF